MRLLQPVVSAPLSTVLGLNSPVTGEDVPLVPFFGLLGKVDVALRDASTSGPHEAGFAYRHWAHVFVEYVDVVVRGWRTDIYLGTADMIASSVNDCDLLARWLVGISILVETD